MYCNNPLLDAFSQFHIPQSATERLYESNDYGDKFDTSATVNANMQDGIGAAAMHSPSLQIEEYESEPHDQRYFNSSISQPMALSNENFRNEGNVKSELCSPEKSLRGSNVPPNPQWSNDESLYSFASQYPVISRCLQMRDNGSGSEMCAAKPFSASEFSNPALYTPPRHIPQSSSVNSTNYAVNIIPPLIEGNRLSSNPTDVNRVALENDFLTNYGLDPSNLSRENSPLSADTSTTISTDVSRERDRRPYYKDGSWWWQFDTGPPVRGVCRQAPKKKDRLILEFKDRAGKVKKYYRCEICLAERNRTEWVFHKNYVHQHIPRHHKNHCSFCQHCSQSIYSEIFNIHVKNCAERGTKAATSSSGRTRGRPRRSILQPPQSPNSLVYGSSPSSGSANHLTEDDASYPTILPEMMNSTGRDLPPYCSATGDWWGNPPLREHGAPSLQSGQRFLDTTQRPPPFAHGLNVNICNEGYPQRNDSRDSLPSRATTGPESGQIGAGIRDYVKTEVFPHEGPESLPDFSAPTPELTHEYIDGSTQKYVDGFQLPSSGWEDQVKLRTETFGGGIVNFVSDEERFFVDGDMGDTAAHPRNAAFACNNFDWLEGPRQCDEMWAPSYAYEAPAPPDENSMYLGGHNVIMEEEHALYPDPQSIEEARNSLYHESDLMLRDNYGMLPQDVASHDPLAFSHPLLLQQVEEYPPYL